MWLMHKKKAMHKSKSVERGEPVDTGVKGMNWSQIGDINIKKSLLHPHKFSSVSNPYIWAKSNLQFYSLFWTFLITFLYPKCRGEKDDCILQTHIVALTAASQDDDRMQQVTGKAAVGVTYKSVHNVYFCLNVWRQCDGSYTRCLLTRNISTITTF